jgi:F-type H+-transporting ATPase subunit epsilon
MLLEILSPDKKVYSGNVYGAQFPGSEGSFEVLEKHAPMIASLKEGIIKVLLDNQSKNFEHFHVSGGVVEVVNNKISVLIESLLEA